MHDTGCLGLVHWDYPEGGYGEGGGFREIGGVGMVSCLQMGQVCPLLLLCGPVHLYSESLGDVLEPRAAPARN